MDARRTPRRILGFHATDQVANFCSDFWPSKTLNAGSQSPEEAKASAVPTDHRIRLDNDYCACPSGPEAVEADPKQSVKVSQRRSPLVALGHNQPPAPSRAFPAQAVSRLGGSARRGDRRATR